MVRIDSTRHAAMISRGHGIFGTNPSQTYLWERRRQGKPNCQGVYQRMCSKFKESKAYPLKSQITNSLPAASAPSPQRDCVVMVTTQRDESFMLENARRLGDRGLAEEALERDLLSCRFICLCLMKTSLPMTRMIDPTFQKPAILKFPKRVTCPSRR
jgi:hypothetical protein